jgi:hypothetical protein
MVTRLEKNTVPIKQLTLILILGSGTVWNWVMFPTFRRNMIIFRGKVYTRERALKQFFQLLLILKTVMKPNLFQIQFRLNLYNILVIQPLYSLRLLNPDTETKRDNKRAEM